MYAWCQLKSLGWSLAGSRQEDLNTLVDSACIFLAISFCAEPISSPIRRRETVKDNYHFTDHQSWARKLLNRPGCKGWVKMRSFCQSGRRFWSVRNTSPGIYIVFFAKLSAGQVCQMTFCPSKILLPCSIGKNCNSKACKCKVYFFVNFMWLVAQYTLQYIMSAKLHTELKLFDVMHTPRWWYCLPIFVLL